MKSDDRELLLGFAMLCMAVVAGALVIGLAFRIFRVVAGV
jgi:hypothetical protein